MCKIKSCIILFNISLFISVTSHAQDNALDVPSELNRVGGMTAAMSEGGIASVCDLSALDNNPATIAIMQDFSLGGEVHWLRNNIYSYDVGIRDSSQATSPISAAFKMRQTTKITGVKDTRFTLGFAERIENSSFTVGIGGDYEKLILKDEEKTKKENYRIRAGGIYELLNSGSQIVLLGIRGEGFIDKVFENKYGVGVAANLGQRYSLNIDGLVNNNSMYKYAVGASVIAQEFLDIFGSYAYQINSRINQGAVGIMIKSQKFKIYYIVSKSNFKLSTIDHIIGASIVIYLNGTTS